MPWILSLLTPFHGRISRKSWWIGIAIIWAVTIASNLLIGLSEIAIAKEPSTGLTLVTLLFNLVIFVAYIALTLKRLNDRDHPRLLGYAWALFYIASIFALPFAIPTDLSEIPTWISVWFWLICLFGLWMFIDNGFLKGTLGPNRYGQDPLSLATDQTNAGAAAPVVARGKRSRGPLARDVIVGALALIAIGGLATPLLSPMRLAFWLTEMARSIVPHQDLDDDPMRANPDAWEAFKAGKAAYMQVKPAEAIPHYNRAIESLGTNNEMAGRVFYWRGSAYEAIGQFQEALKDYSEAIAQEPESEKRYSSRAGIYVRLGHYGDAIKDFDKAISLKPGKASNYFERGYPLYRLGRVEEALSSYEKTLEVAQEEYDDIKKFHEGVARYRIESLTEQSQSITELSPLRRDRYSAMAQTRRGILLSGLERTDEALSAFDEAIRLLRNLERSAKAVSGFDPDIWTRPEYALAYRHRGLLHEQRGSIELARADYERAAALKEPDAALRDALKRVRPNSPEGDK